jgi:hypothetical protein
MLWCCAGIYFQLTRLISRLLLVSAASQRNAQPTAFLSTRRLGTLSGSAHHPEKNAISSSEVDVPDLRLRRVKQLLEFWEGCELRKTSLQLPSMFPSLPSPHYGSTTNRYPTRWFTQFIVVAERAWVYKLRSPDAVVSQFFASVIMSVMMGSFFYAMPLTQVSASKVESCAPRTQKCAVHHFDAQSGARDRVMALGFILMALSFMAMDQVQKFSLHLTFSGWCVTCN